MAKAPTDIRSLARSHTESALRVLSSIMNEPSAPHAARVAAANSLIDRGWGRAHQSIEISGDVKHNVIRAPVLEITTEAWSEKHAPHAIN